MRRLFIALAGLGLVGSAGRCCPVPSAPAGSIFAIAEDRAIPAPYEAFWAADAVSARLREITADPFRGTAGLEQVPTRYQGVTDTDQTPDPWVYETIKLLLGFCFALIAAFMYWVSPAYEELYERLFGKLSDF